MHVPCPTLQARIAAGTATPPVDTPATPPAADTHATHKALHPVWHIEYPINPDSMEEREIKIMIIDVIRDIMNV